MEVFIDREDCISCGLCAETCPDIFNMADDGFAEVIKTPSNSDEEDGAQEAADNCPVSVIHTT